MITPVIAKLTNGKRWHKVLPNVEFVIILLIDLQTNVLIMLLFDVNQKENIVDGFREILKSKGDPS